MHLQASPAPTTPRSKTSRRGRPHFVQRGRPQVQSAISKTHFYNIKIKTETLPTATPIPVGISGARGVCSLSKRVEDSLLVCITADRTILYVYGLTTAPFTTCESTTVCTRPDLVLRSSGSRFTRLHGVALETCVRVLEVLWSSRRQIKLQPTRQELYRPQAHGVASGLEPAAHIRWTQQHVKQLELA